MLSYRRNDSYLGGFGLLALCGVLCMRGLKKLDQRLREQEKKQETQEKRPEH